MFLSRLLGAASLTRKMNRNLAFRWKVHYWFGLNHPPQITSPGVSSCLKKKLVMGAAGLEQPRLGHRPHRRPGGEKSCGGGAAPTK